ncbi:MAG TPA: condensin subunit MukF [Planctomycetota bacterium]|nr:condensin subunit MukF [Planctomycetota bacterium]
MDPIDPSRAVAALARDKAHVDLKTVDLCFLAALHLRAGKTGLASFDEDALFDLFEQACDVVEPGADNPRTRATHAVRRLREQRFLARVDGAGLVRAGEYALTRLAAAVVEFFLAEETLTRESLTLLTGTLRAQLAQVLAAARKADGADAWRLDVVGPLDVTVRDLVSGIERRQRGLDAQQEEVRAEITALLGADWFAAIERCQALLESTTATLNELNGVLLRDSHHFVALLQEIAALAGAAEEASAEDAAHRVVEHVDRIAAWGAARQRAWSEYYQSVHRFLRDVVRLDADRALSRRLRDQIAAWPSKPFHLLAARAPSIVLLRAPEARAERPAVARPRSDREAPPEATAATDAAADLEAAVRRALADGASTLAEATRRVLAEVPAPARYAAAGEVAALAVRLAAPTSACDRPWVDVAPRLEIEDWTDLGPESRE